MRLRAAAVGERGWPRTAVALGVTETVSWGILYYAFAVLLVPMRAELGWSTAAASGAFSVALLTCGLAAPLVGRWIDRRGPRRVMTAGSALAVLLVAAWGRVDNLPALYGVWALIGVVMAATLYEPAIAAVARYPSRERRLALLVITTAAALASTIFTPAASFLVGQVGWRSALLVLATILALVTVPLHGVALPGAPSVGQPWASAGAGRARPGGDALRSAFVRIVTAFTLTKAIGVAVTVHIVAYLVAQGHGPGTAAALAGAIGVAKIVGRGAVALIRIDITIMAVVALAAHGTALLLLLFWPTTVGVAAFAVVFGAVSGAVTLLRPELIAEHLGTDAFGRLNGQAALPETVVAALAPFGFGLSVTLTGGYAAGWLPLAAAGLVAATVIAPLQRARAPRVAS